MSTTTDRSAISVALLGNPNTGKSTVFNLLVGVHQRVGNYPGVTVEKRLGQASFADHEFTFIDLPGTYSLAPQSPDEMVAVDVLLGRRGDVARPDVILCILDATNLDRNLYLLSQAMELGRPIVVALNMMDLAEQRGLRIDTDELAKRLGVPMVPMQAHRRLGFDALWQTLLNAAYADPPHNRVEFPAEFSAEVDQLQQWLLSETGETFSRYLVARLLLDTSHYMENLPHWGDVRLRNSLWDARQRLERAGHQVPGVETDSRYRWVDSMLDGMVQGSESSRPSRTDRIDRILTSRFTGIAVFLLVMIIVFQSIFNWTAPLNSVIEGGEGWLGQQITGLLPAGMLQSLLVDGVLAGVGAVLAFLPQIALLFFFLAILEDCGYMARAAYLMDGIMTKVGLSGKSFIPLLSSFACAVPGILSARVIENRRDRLVTILIAPLMSCSARLPVYALLIGAFIPNEHLLGSWLGLQGVTMFALYSIGIITAIIVAKVFRGSVLRGETPPFVLELPDYRLPMPRVVAARVMEQCSVFVRNAGTLILAVTVIVWAAAYFPHGPEVRQRVDADVTNQLAQLDAQITSLNGPASTPANATDLEALETKRSALADSREGRVAAAYMEQSWLGRMGKLIAPVVRPLGWDWRVGCAVVASFPAREVVIGAMGVIYNLGDAADTEPRSLATHLREVTWPDSDRKVFTIPVALSIMVFYALCAQCAATLIVIARETGSRRWSWFTFGYMTVLAYTGALLTYQLGTLISAR